MKGSLIGPILVAVFVSVTAVSLYASFRFSTVPKIDSWRLTRVAMIHSHLMASEYLQDEIGIVDISKLKKLTSRGYSVEYEIIDPEEPIIMPRDLYGYSDDSSGGDGEPIGTASYALPIVYGPDHKFGFLHVTISRDPNDEDWIGSAYDTAVRIFDDLVGGV